MFVKLEASMRLMFGELLERYGISSWVKPTFKWEMVER